MSLAQVKVGKAVELAASDEWGVPEFQRGFVWKPGQVRDLLDSLWSGYPTGGLLLWEGKGHIEPRWAGGKPGTLWLIDGQQRTTALCILFGKRPHWWPDAKGWSDWLGKFDIRLDLARFDGSPFVLANSVIKKAAGSRYIPVRWIFESDGEALLALAAQAKAEKVCGTLGTGAIFERLQEVKRIADRDLPVVTIDHTLEEVIEIFARVNSKGTPVKEADIYLGVLASKMEQKGWVRSEFLGYIKDLEEDGFDLEPSLLFRCLIAIGAGRARLKDVEESFWTATRIMPAWTALRSAFLDLKTEFERVGLFGTQLLSTKTALVPLLALRAKWPSSPLQPALRWFLLAGHTERFGKASETALQQDLTAIAESSSGPEAVNALVHNLGTIHPVTADDLLRDYSEYRFGRLMLYLLAYQNGARDWDRDHSARRIGFDDSGVARGFTPQWHHVFPRKYLERQATPDSDPLLADALANIAVIGPRANIRISAKAPMDYLAREAIDDVRLAQQYIEPSLRHTPADAFEGWVRARAQRLADASNAYFDGLA